MASIVLIDLATQTEGISPRVDVVFNTLANVEAAISLGTTRSAIEALSVEVNDALGGADVGRSSAEALGNGYEGPSVGGKASAVVQAGRGTVAKEAVTLIAVYAVFTVDGITAERGI